MKINLPEQRLDHHVSPSKRAADVAIANLDLLSWRPTKPARLNSAVRCACSDAYTDAMNGGRGDWVEQRTGEFLIRVRMGTIDSWEVEVWSKQA
jgi:hypothetical protein